MKIVVENIFMCLVLFWKCYFPTHFSHFLSYFLSIQTNFITKNFKITAKSQHHTPPKLQFNPRQQTLAIKSHKRNKTKETKSSNPVRLLRWGDWVRSARRGATRGSWVRGATRWVWIEGQMRWVRGKIARQRRDRAEAIEGEIERRRSKARSARCSGFIGDVSGMIWTPLLPLVLSLCACV